MLLGLVVVAVLSAIWLCKSLLRPSLPAGMPFVPSTNKLLGLFFEYQEMIKKGTLYKTLTQWGNTLGPIYSFPLLNKNLIVISEYEAIKMILSDTETYPMSKAMGKVFGEVATNGLLALKGDAHKRHRKLLTPLFSTAQLRYIHDCVSTEMDGFEHKLSTGPVPKGQPIEMVHEMRSFGMNVIGKSAFGTDFNEGARHEEYLKEVGKGLLQRSPVPYPWLWPIIFKGNALWRTCLNKAHALVASLLDKKTDSNGMPLPQQADKKKDMLDVMLATRVEEKTTGVPGLTQQEILDEIMMFYLAGHGPTSATTMWLVYMLAQHPAKALKLRTEIAAVCADRKPTYDDVQKMPYLEAFIKETMRIYSPAPIISRETSRDVTILGHHIAAGTKLMINLYGMHRDARYWSNPLEFEPERWLAEDAGKFAYLPFGHGLKMCVGWRFAQTEHRLFLARLVQNYSVEMVAGQDIQPFSAITLYPGGPMNVYLWPCREVAPGAGMENEKEKEGVVAAA